MSLVDTIIKYAPTYWCPHDGGQKQLLTHSLEYKKIAYEVQEALKIPRGWPRSLTMIVRIQNKHDFGQCLVREQLLLANAKTNQKFFRVRRYMKLKKAYLDAALKFNLDYRRCGLRQLVLYKSIPIQQLVSDEVVIIVQAITADPDADEIKPSTNIEYFIDYVVYL